MLQSVSRGIKGLTVEIQDGYGLLYYVLRMKN